MEDNVTEKLIEEVYRSLVESVKDYAIIMLDPDGKVILWNEGAKRIKGYTKEEIIGKHFSIFYPKEAVDAGYPQYELKKARERGKFEDEGWRIKKDGTRFWANVVITAIYQNNELIGFAKITRDLSERKRAESELKKSEEKYRLLVEGVKDYAIIMLNLEGCISTWNEGAKNIFGYREEEIAGESFALFYTENARNENVPSYELEQAKELHRFEGEALRVRKDGSVFWGEMTFNILRDDYAKLVGYSLIIRDLTEKRKAEEEFRFNEERYRILVEGVKDYAIFMLDPNGFITTWNEGAKRLKGYSQDEVIGRHFSIFYPQEARDRKYPEYELKQAIKTGRYEDEGWRVRKDGSMFYANVIITALFNQAGQLMGFSKITRDLTDRKAAELRLKEINTELEQRVEERTQELTKSFEELKKINADLDNFIYTASHDLKAPMSNIEGLIYTLSDILSEHSIHNEELESVLSLMKQSIVKFQGTIRDLTEINVTQKDVQGEKTVVDLAGIIEDVKISIANLISSANATIETNTVECPQINFSRRHINSILYNLITNAIKYKSPERDPVIKITSYFENKYIVIVVEDNGLGIRQSNFGKLFHMFKRFNDHVEGTGVGLYIVKRIIDNVGGKIEVESDFGKGSIFKVYLPIDSKK